MPKNTTELGELLGSPAYNRYIDPQDEFINSQEFDDRVRSKYIESISDYHNLFDALCESLLVKPDTVQQLITAYAKRDYQEIGKIHSTCLENYFASRNEDEVLSEWATDNSNAY